MRILAGGFENGKYQFANKLDRPEFSFGLKSGILSGEVKGSGEVC